MSSSVHVNTWSALDLVAYDQPTALPTPNGLYESFAYPTRYGAVTVGFVCLLPCRRLFAPCMLAKYHYVPAKTRTNWFEHWFQTGLKFDTIRHLWSTYCKCSHTFHRVKHVRLESRVKQPW